MYVIDYESLNQARAKDRVKALRRVQGYAADECLEEIEAVNPDYYDELIEAMHEPIGDEQRGRIVEYKAITTPEDERSVLECSEAKDHADEPLDYCYEQQERHGVEGLLPDVDGWYDLPTILGNAMYYKPTAAEVARAEHRRRYGITEGDNGIYDICYDSKGNLRGGKSGITRNRRTKAEVEAARKAEAKAKRKEERERAKLLARVAAQRA